MIFERPLDSPEQTRFLALAESADIDKGAVQKLFWLIDAHPRLLSFVQIAQNLVAIFDAVPLVDLGEASGLEWPALIPTWQRFCRWVSDNPVRSLPARSWPRRACQGTGAGKRLSAPKDQEKEHGSRKLRTQPPPQRQRTVQARGLCLPVEQARVGRRQGHRGLVQRRVPVAPGAPRARLGDGTRNLHKPRRIS